MDATTLLETTKARLIGHKSRYAEISRTTGISYSTLTKLAQGHSDNPTVSNLQAVIEALDEFERQEASPSPPAPPASNRIDTPEAVTRLLGVSRAGAEPAPAPAAAAVADPEPEPEVPGDSRVVPFEAPP
jgi:transcriptional regulator with XRE-family HTH domain